MPKFQLAGVDLLGASITNALPLFWSPAAYTLPAVRGIDESGRSNWPSVILSTHAAGGLPCLAIVIGL